MRYANIAVGDKNSFFWEGETKFARIFFHSSSKISRYKLHKLTNRKSCFWRKRYVSKKGLYQKFQPKL